MSKPIIIVVVVVVIDVVFVKKKLGPKKILVQKILGTKKDLGPKNFGYRTKCCPDKSQLDSQHLLKMVPGSYL